MTETLTDEEIRIILRDLKCNSISINQAVKLMTQFKKSSDKGKLIKETGSHNRVPPLPELTLKSEFKTSNEIRNI